MNSVDKVIKVATNEVGYLEKSKTAYQKNPNIIYEKTAGAGQDNITKYNKEMHDIYPSVMDFPCKWCASFVSWCFYKAYGITTAKSLLAGNFEDYTVAACGMYQKKNALYTEPKIGDQVFFTKNGKPSGCYHTGIVYDVDSIFFYTIEGNTSNASTVVSNGGGVAKKKYYIKNMKGQTLFGRPKYDTTYATLDEVVAAVLRGEYGNNPQRRAKLLDEGWNPSIVQAEINRIKKQENLNTLKRDIPQYTWKFLMDKINNAYGVAGLMGNLQAESGLKPTNMQNSFEKKLGMNDDSYTMMVDSGMYKDFVTDKCGYGIAQWTYYTRKRGLLESKGNKSIGDIEVQLNFLMKELSTSYKGVLSGLKSAKSVREASDLVLTKFERPANQSEVVKKKRAEYGQEFYNKFCS